MTTFRLRDHSEKPFSREELGDACSALNFLCDHVREAWGVTHQVRLMDDVDSDEEDTELEEGDIELAIFDDGKKAATLGYHATDPRGAAYGHILRSDVGRATGGPNAHDSLVMLAGRRLLALAFGAHLSTSLWHDRGNATEEAFVIGDRVAGSSYVLTRGAPEVSGPNFLRRAAFEPDADGPYDWAGLLTSPAQVLPGGYSVGRTIGVNAQRRDGSMLMVVSMALLLEGHAKVAPDELRRLGHPSSPARRRGLAAYSKPQATPAEIPKAAQ